MDDNLILSADGKTVTGVKNINDAIEIVIPDGVTEIGWGAFIDCASMTSVMIPNSVREIAGCAFMDCSGLKSVNIPNGVVVIGGCAFSGCRELRSINIPNSMTEIGEGAFWECYKLNEIRCEMCNNIYDVMVYNEAFSEEHYEQATLYVPTETRWEYREHSVWGYFKKIYEINDINGTSMKQNDKHGKIYLFFDTETTGLPLNYNTPACYTSNWPRLVQLSWIMAYEDETVITTRDYIIKPNGFEIPYEATRVHGISTKRAMQEGRDLEEVLSEFEEVLNNADVIVGHNIDFDVNVVASELCRLHKKDVISRRKRICTMKRATSYCAIPGYDGYKWPKLDELYYVLFGSSFANAHDSWADISATMKCFYELKKWNII